MADDFARLASHYEDAVLLERRVVQRHESRASRMSMHDGECVSVPLFVPPPFPPTRMSAVSTN